MMCMGILYGRTLFARACLRQRQGGYGIRPYILSPDKVENVGRGLAPSVGVEDAAPYRDGCLLFQCQQQFPQYLAGRGSGNAALVEHGGQLVHVRANDVRFRHGADGPK